MAIASYIADRAEELLDAAEASLTLARTGTAVPARTYRSHGPPAVDWCNEDLLVVYLDNPAIKLSNPSQNRALQAGQYETMPVARYVVELWRCAPNIDDQGTPPTATPPPRHYRPMFTHSGPACGSRKRRGHCSRVRGWVAVRPCSEIRSPCRRREVWLGGV
jgi:hypothetical protein